MRTRGGRALVVVALLVALVAGLAWWRSDRRRILARLDTIEDAAARRPGESRLVAVANASRIADVFDEPFEVVARPLDFATRDRRELVRAVHAYRTRSEAVMPRFSVEELTVDGDTGRASLHLRADFVTGAADFLGNEGYRFHLAWAERDGEWRIDFAELLEVVPAR